MKHPNFRDTGASDGPPDGTHQWTEELLIQQFSIPDGQATRFVKEGSKHSQSLQRFLSHLIHTSRPGQPFVKGYHQITGGIDPLD